MAKTMAFLEYAFLFDPKDTWQHLSQFENAFARFLREHNMEAQILNSINPKDGRRIVYIRAMDPVDEARNTNVKPTAPQDVIKKWSSDAPYGGKK